MSTIKTEIHQVDSEKVKTAKLALKAMGVEPEDLITLPSISLELKLRLDYDPKDETPVKVELIKVESVSNKSDKSNLTIDDIRDFIKQKAGDFLTEVSTERYIGYKSAGNPRRYLILIEQRADNHIAISINKKEIQDWDSLKFIGVENFDGRYDHLIYVYPTPEDEASFMNFISECRNGIGEKIPKDLIEGLEKLNCLSIAHQNSRFSYMQTWLIPIEHSKSFLIEFLENWIDNWINAY